MSDQWDHLRRRITDDERVVHVKGGALRELLDAADENERLRQVAVNSATDARILVKALEERNQLAAASLAERLAKRLRPWDVSEEAT